MVSFNIKWLGHYKDKENVQLAQFLAPYDLIAVQELVDPPFEGVYEDGIAYVQDQESLQFFKAMEQEGFSYWISNGDSGKEKNHIVGPTDEWSVVFYKATKLIPDSSRFYGFVDTPLVLNPVFDRVPYVFPFCSVDRKSTFSVVNLHLTQGAGAAAIQQRQKQFQHLMTWVKSQKERNQDFLLMGDCNVYRSEELFVVHQHGYKSLNSALKPTTTTQYSSGKGNPFDHCFYGDSSQYEIIGDSFQVLDLRAWLLNQKAINMMGIAPFKNGLFSYRYSDHLPIQFLYILGIDTD